MFALILSILKDIFKLLYLFSEWYLDPDSVDAIMWLTILPSSIFLWIVWDTVFLIALICGVPLALFITLCVGVFAVIYTFVYEIFVENT